MGRANRSRYRVSSRRAQAQAKQRRQRVMILLGSAAAGLLALAALASVQQGGERHPAPRIAQEQPPVMPAARYAQYPRVADTYRMAAVVPEVLDGLYCYCQCSQHSGHYSLLDCFASDHAARCDICMSEGSMGYQMSQNGASLDEIRAEIDRTFGT